MNFANFVFALHDTSGIAKYGNEGGGGGGPTVVKGL